MCLNDTILKFEANVGDSTAVMVQKRNFIVLSKEHKPDDTGIPLILKCDCRRKEEN